VARDLQLAAAMGRRGWQGIEWIAIVAVALSMVAARAARQGHDWDRTATGLAAAAAGASVAERSAAADFYARRGGRPAWHDASGQSTAGARAVRELLAGIDAHGLDPDEYRLSSAPASAIGGPMAADVALTVGALRAMRHLHLGRVDPTTLALHLPVWSEPHDFVALLDAGVAQGAPASAIVALAPPYALYTRLVDARRRYRALAAAGPLPAVPPFTRSVHPGDPYPAPGALDARLRAFGDLPESTPPHAAGTTVYDGPVVEAVRHFQRRHGLTADGVLGMRTVLALQVSPEARVRQITLALERLRWLPDLGSRRLVAVNIPMFRLWAWDAARDDATPALAMDVIVGRAVRTHTPVFLDAMEYVNFRPYWNVPHSILQEEVLPALRRDNGYLARQQMEVVGGASDEARVMPVDGAAFGGLAAGALRIRQRPGPHNALGLVKFMFPNSANVYMHGTPAIGLFARDRRDFSHGCIRVADPPALAAWVLGRQHEAWPAARIAAAMTGPDNVRVQLDAPIDVAIFYLTAAVLPEDGAVHFAADVYGHDARLVRALERRRQPE
jgi:murein L,D-transpeptidase YcbB/YkuD